MAETEEDAKGMRSAAVVAFSCRPKSGSEWGVGWNYVRMISRLFGTVTLFVRDAEEQVERTRIGLAEEGIHNVEIVPLKDLWVYQFFKPRAIHLRFLTIYYVIWLWYVFALLLKDRTWRRRTHLFHVTLVSDWIYSPLFLLPFRKRIVGPIGTKAANFNPESRDFLVSRVQVAIKTVLRVISPNIFNVVRSDAVVGITHWVLQRYPWKLARNREIVPYFSELRRLDRSRAESRKIFFIGKYLACKNLDLFLDVVVPLLRADPDLTVDILGDTLGQATADEVTTREGLESRIVAHGVVPHDEVGRYLGEYRSILLQTSSEAGGTIGSEGLAFGVPIVCVSGYGVDSFFERGTYPYAVPYSDRQQYIRDAGKLIRGLFNDYPRNSLHAAELGQKVSFASSLNALQEVIDRAQN